MARHRKLNKSSTRVRCRGPGEEEILENTKATSPYTMMAAARMEMMVKIEDIALNEYPQPFQGEPRGESPPARAPTLPAATREWQMLLEYRPEPGLHKMLISG